MKNPGFGILPLLFACLLTNAPAQPVADPARDAMRRMASLPGDPCEAPWSDGSFAENEAPVFNAAWRAVVTALNEKPAASPRKAAEDAIAPLERESEILNRAWDKELRFHAEVHSISGLLVVSVQFRAHARWFAIASSAEHGKAGKRWQVVGEDELEVDHPAPRSDMAIYPVENGASGAPRFLVRAFYTGCAGSSGLQYKLQEWQPQDGFVSTLLSQEGAQGMDPQPGPVTRKNPFPVVGELKTSGSRLVLPYCYFSPVDTWDNPDLCVADTYAVSTGGVRFVSRLVNRPDVQALASALSYAATHDERALAAYCVSADVAKSLLGGVPFLDLEVEVTEKSRNRETVETGAGRFFMLKRKAGWVVAGWKSE